MSSVLQKIGSVLVVSLLFCVLSGCALLNTGTQVSDGNAVMKLPEYKGLKHAVGCKDFENQAGWKGQWELGNNLSILLESALFDTGRFVIVEREKLGNIIAEQDLVASGRAAAAKKAAKTGLIRPVRYLATGAVTEASEGTSGSSGGVSFKGVSLGGGGGKATVTIIAKLVDTTTGEVVAKQRIVGKAGRKSLNVGLNYKGLSTDMGGFQKTPMGEAAQDCINQAAIFLAKAVEELPFEGSVVKVSGADVIINRGSDVGMAVGKALVMREEGELLTDPDTGAILGREDGKQLGELKVTKVLEKMSYCQVVSGEKKPKAGTVVSEK